MQRCNTVVILCYFFRTNGNLLLYMSINPNLSYDRTSSIDEDIIIERTPHVPILYSATTTYRCEAKVCDLGLECNGIIVGEPQVVCAILRRVLRRRRQAKRKIRLYDITRNGFVPWCRSC